MKHIFRKKILSIAIVIAIAGGSLFLVSYEKQDFKILKNLDIFYTLFRELNMYYVDETDPEELIEESIDGMLESLDPYTTFISEADMADFKFMTTGQYGGIGALIRKSDDYTIIADPYKGFPADNAGLKAGDLIKAIDGKTIQGKDVSEVSDMLKGAPNTELQLKILSPGETKTRVVKLMREEIKISGVPYAGMVDDEIGYIRISSFTRNVSKDVQKSLKDLKENQGAKKVILDLRSNPGGLLNEAVEISGLFVNKGQEIVSTKGKVTQFDAIYRTSNSPMDTIIPMVVLVNRGSASASEIVAGSMQDLDRAVVVGQRTFGKGLVQSSRPLSYNTHLKVTTAKYYIPSGRCIQALDYSNRNEDGSVGEIPDSLISVFETENGRKVYDGGGIRPDIKAESEDYGKITISLFTKNLIFDYATQFTIENDTIPIPEEFEITDEEYGQFKSFLSDKDYDYTTKSDETLDELIKTAKKEKYYKIAEEEFDALEQKLAHDKQKDLETFKDEIKELLREEIAGRYYYQQGTIRASLQDDKQLDKAIEVLKDESLYSGILDGSIKIDSSLFARYHY